ncbi:MAG TPA: NAD(P)-dependent oxidoreductase [Gemmatimonadota bacterium]|nr:NAD(P)-dependent oxidoreductase [Gemmatimonadota bacterium]
MGSAAGGRGGREGAGGGSGAEGGAEGTSGGPGLVLVARELVPLCGEAPPWPGGRETRFVASDEPLPSVGGSGAGGDGREAARVEALIPLLSREVGAAQMDGLPSLRIVANYAVGFDNIDVGAAEERGIVVANTPDVLTEATADLAWALLLAAARRLREGLDEARSGAWEGWRPDQLLGMGLREKSLVILGAGRIGSAVARRAPAFGMAVLYWSRSRNEALEEETGARRVERLEDALAAADVLSLHLPLTEETGGLLGADELALLPPNALLVNTARGEIVDTGALVGALREGPLAAAGIDVYPDEPEVPAALRELPDAFVLPHLGSATREARRAMWELAAANVRRVLQGRPARTAVTGPASEEGGG